MVSEFDVADHGADASKLGRGASRDDEARALAARDQRAGIGHRGAIAERSVRGDWVGRLVGRGRLAGQRRFLDPQVRGAQQPEIGGNAVARFGQHDVADRQAFGGNGQPPSVAQDRRLAGQHGANGLERLFRPAFLDEADRGVDEDDGEDDHGVKNVAQQDCDRRRSEEHIDQEVVELGEQAREQRARLARRQPVRPVRLEPVRGFLGGQTLSGRPAALECGRGRFGVPGAFCRRAQSLHRSIESCDASRAPPRVGSASKKRARPQPRRRSRRSLRAL